MAAIRESPSDIRPPTSWSSPEAFSDLIDSERGVLRLMASGTNNATIARELPLLPKTVRNHLSNIFGNLQVGDRAQAIGVAREAGLQKP